MTFLKSKLQEAINKKYSDLIVVGCGQWDRKNLLLVASDRVGTYDCCYFLYNIKKNVVLGINPFRHMSKFDYASRNVVKLI